MSYTDANECISVAGETTPIGQVSVVLRLHPLRWIAEKVCVVCVRVCVCVCSDRCPCLLVALFCRNMSGVQTIAQLKHGFSRPTRQHPASNWSFACHFAASGAAARKGANNAPKKRRVLGLDPLRRIAEKVAVVSRRGREKQTTKTDGKQEKAQTANRRSRRQLTVNEMPCSVDTRESAQ
jgi:hypothetical protein